VDLYVLLRQGRLDEAGDLYRWKNQVRSQIVKGNMLPRISAIERDVKMLRFTIRRLGEA
jgi:hypothetical protein